MRFGARFRWIAAGAVVLGGAGSAAAQSAGGAASAEGSAGAPNANVGFERRPQLSPGDMLTQADVIVRRMDQSSSTVRRQLDSARTARDVVKSLCLSDKLSQVDVAKRSARDRQTALQAAVQRNDSELSNHEFVMITVLRQRAEQLAAEANQCIGEEVAFVGQTQVTTSIDPNLPVEDSTVYPPTEPPVVYGPPQTTSSTGLP
jgi:hypothetical protein